MTEKQVYWTVLPERAILERPFINFMRIAERAGELGYKYIPLRRMRVDIARDELALEFKRLSQNPDDVLVSLDADHNHPTNIIEWLVADDKPVVGALAFRSNPSNPSPCFWKRDQNGILRTPRTWEKELIQVSIVGTGAIAIRRSVFTKLDEFGFDHGYFMYQYPPDGTRVSEEITLMQMLERVRIPVFVDTRIVTPHWADGEIDESSWEQWCAEHPVEKREHKVSVIIPQRGRAQKLKDCLWSLYETAPSVEVIVIADDDEEYEIELPPNFTSGNAESRLGIMVYNPRDTAANKWNEGSRIASGDVLMLGANDTVYHDGWLENALDALDNLPNGEGVVGTNDKRTDGNISSPHYLVTRKWLDENYGGTMACPLYGMQFLDVDISEVAKEKGQYAWAQASIVEHNHPLTNSAPQDEIHREGYAKYYDADQKLFLQRRQEGFPITWGKGERKDGIETGT